MGSSSKIAPEWGRKGSEMAEEEERELRLPLLVGRVLDILPTKSLGDPRLSSVWRDGASRPATHITTSMGPLEGGSVEVELRFSEIGGLWEIKYTGISINERMVRYPGVDPWFVVRLVWRWLPPKSQR